MVIVPIATAFEIMGLLFNIIAAGCSNLIFGWVSFSSPEQVCFCSAADDDQQIALGWVALAMVLSWASFGVTYKFTDTVQSNLRMYNEDPMRVIDSMLAKRGNAVWFILASAVSDLYPMVCIGTHKFRHS